ncbi:transporter substrate-binding domain-containing protein [Duganella sp. FT135W]|uniref:Transporter substrate-binding domain-containing protein n=1 Tax=Duganella flavida TaxID=2692175 RepID=A0A6L8K769_9BURK|nr:transporter substrate-binding domain-containing protein [Duganella flavida]MYM23339.1 transporter substrate-binding domain-containing protein [Duganella flavida]
MSKLSPGRRSLLIDAALCLALPAASVMAAPAGLRAVTLTAPLFGMEGQGAPSGIFVDVMSELSRASGVQITNAMVPKVRGQALLKAGEADLMIGFDSAELQACARHVALVASFDVGIVARSGIRLRALSDLHGKTVGQLRSADYFAPFEQDSASLKYNTNTMTQMVKMLALGRVDAVIGVRESLYYAFQGEGIAPERIGDFLPLTSREAWLHYANSSYDAATADKLAGAMRRMRDGGSIAAIVARYVRK